MTSQEAATGPRSPVAWLAAALALAAVCLAPFVLTDVPPVLDYPNHLARFWILAHPDDPLLSPMYAPRWTVLPNLGMDALGALLLSVTPVHVGGRMLLAFSLLAPLIGVAIHARAAFGRWTWWSLAAGVIAYNGVFILGFMNFQVGLGVALVGTAAWRVLRARAHPAATAGVGLLAGLAAFFCHLLGFAFFAILVAAQEGETLLGLWRRGAPVLRRLRTASAMLGVALAPTLLLYVATHRQRSGGDALVWVWQAKPLQALTPFMTYDFRLCMLTAVAVVGAIILIWRRTRRAPGVALALAILALLYLAAPLAAGGGTFLDTRIPVMIALLVFAGTAPEVPARTARRLAVLFVALIAVRTANVAWAWHGRSLDLADLRGSLALIEPGAKILPVYKDTIIGEADRRGRLLPQVSELDEHIGALAVVERGAFWPSLFADPSQQPLAVRPAYADVALPLSTETAWDELGNAPGASRFAPPAAWRLRYDYVLMVGAPVDPATTPDGLVLLRRGEAASLYRIAPRA